MRGLFGAQDSLRVGRRRRAEPDLPPRALLGRLVTPVDLPAVLVVDPDLGTRSDGLLGHEYEARQLRRRRGEHLDACVGSARVVGKDGVRTRPRGARAVLKAAVNEESKRWELERKRPLVGERERQDWACVLADHLVRLKGSAREQAEAVVARRDEGPISERAIRRVVTRASAPPAVEHVPARSAAVTERRTQRRRLALVAAAKGVRAPPAQHFPRARRAALAHRRLLGGWARRLRRRGEAQLLGHAARPGHDTLAA
eukprot:1730387-Pleurochrysis_carterae.AAC.1